MSNPSRGPRSLPDILGELFTVRGYGRLWARQELEDTWNKTVGEPYCRQTQLGEVRRGVLNVTVADSALLEELVSFRKATLLAALRSGALATAIHDIRFRVGAVVAEVEVPGVTAWSSARPLSEGKPTGRRQAAPERRVVPGKSKPDDGSDAGTGSTER
jgi:predicted nucleic acid-binding Zn ribbon protein